MSANDPLTFIAVCGLLLGVVIAAAYVRGRRATRVDPIVARNRGVANTIVSEGFATVPSAWPLQARDNSYSPIPALEGT